MRCLKNWYESMYWVALKRNFCEFTKKTTTTKWTLCLGVNLFLRLSSFQLYVKIFVQFFPSFFIPHFFYQFFFRFAGYHKQFTLICMDLVSNNKKTSKDVGICHRRRRISNWITVHVMCINQNKSCCLSAILISLISWWT